MKTKNLLTTTLLLISIISLIAMSPLSNAQQTTNLSISPSTMQLTVAQVGTTINVNLTVSNVQNLFGWNLNLTWNPQVLNLTQIQEGSFLTDAGATLFTWSPSSSPISRSQGYLQGVANVLLASSGVNGNGVLATISFKVLGTGNSPISIDGTTISNPPSNGVAKTITATITNGVVNVGTSNASPTPTAIPTTNPTATPSSNPTTPPTKVPTTATPTPTSHSSVTPTQNPTPTVPEFQGIISIMFVLLLSSVGIILLKKTKSISIKQ